MDRIDRLGNVCKYVEWEREAIFRLKNGGYVGVVYDTYPESPREWSTLGTMNISGSWGSIEEEEFDYEEVMENYGLTIGKSAREDIEKLMAKAREHNNIILPVSVYDHSMQHFYVGFPTQRWDNYITGFIWAKEEDIKENFMVDEVTDKELDHTETILKGEIETFNQYANGEVYGFRTYDDEGNDDDSCYGFYGDEALVDIQNEVGEIEEFIGTYNDIYECLEDIGEGHYEWIPTKKTVMEVA